MQVDDALTYNAGSKSRHTATRPAKAFARNYSCTDFGAGTSRECTAAALLTEQLSRAGFDLSGLFSAATASGGIAFFWFNVILTEVNCLASLS